jgi:hypothetical protein
MQIPAWSSKAFCCYHPRSEAHSSLDTLEKVLVRFGG